MAIRPAPRPIRGLTAMTTRVSFQPPIKPTVKPKMKVEILSIKMDTWSAMAPLILLISLEHKKRNYLLPICQNKQSVNLTKQIYNTVLWDLLRYPCV